MSSPGSRIAIFSILALAFAGMAGCGGGNGIRITGNATLDGEPIDTGSLSFVPDDGKGPTVGGSIESGKFDVTGLTPGKKRVTVIMAAPGDEKGGNQRQRMEERLDERRAAKSHKQAKPASKPTKAQDVFVEIAANMAPLSLDFKTHSAGR
jgi:hypothetical protein